MVNYCKSWYIKKTRFKEKYSTINYEIENSSMLFNTIYKLKVHVDKTQNTYLILFFFSRAVSTQILISLLF